MPNGDQEWGIKEYPKLEEFFSKISEVLEDFAKIHNLLIDKYYHQGHDWSFLFRHPKGGIGKLQVQKCNEEHVKIYPMWWIDHYEENRRDSKHSEGLKIPIEKNVLRKELENLFQVIIGWEKEELEEGTPNPYCIWKNIMTRNKFKKENEKYPIPKID